MPRPRWLGAVLMTIAVVVLALALWATLGYLATAPLGMIYGWSGHPSVPDAPAWVYAVLYLVLLPAVALGAAWATVRAAARRLSGRGRAP